MDWTIVGSVLVALLLWLVVVGSVVALVAVTAGTVLRGRVRGLMEQKMAHCNPMFSSFAPATAGGGTSAPAPCPCAETPEAR